MYREKTQSFDHLTRSFFAAAAASIKPDILQQTWAEVNYQLRVCRPTNGALIETN